jgi:hypothetical protein
MRPMFDWIVSNPIAYPALEVVHIVGIALLLGNLVLLELRVWGLGAPSCRCSRWPGWRWACRCSALRWSAPAADDVRRAA